MPTPVHVAVAALRRLDTLVSAGLAGICTGSLAEARLCDDASCSSGLDVVLHLAVVALGGAGAALLLRRHPRRWWGRAAVVPVALYAALVVPPLVRARGRWTLPTPAGSCVVRAGAPVEVVRRACGDPTSGCVGPRFIQAERWWNPLATDACRLRGEVYGDRLVTYDCGGLVFSVDAFGAGLGPQGCAAPP